MRFPLALLFGIIFASVATASPIVGGAGVRSPSEAQPVTAHEELSDPALMLATVRGTTFGFSVTVDEYCDNQTKKMGLQWINTRDHASVDIPDMSDPGAAYFVNTEVGPVKLTMGTGSSVLNFQFGTCKWSMDRFNSQACGFCVVNGWKGNGHQPDCKSKPIFARSYIASCIFDFTRAGPVPMPYDIPKLIKRKNIPYIDTPKLIKRKNIPSIDTTTPNNPVHALTNPPTTSPESLVTASRSRVDTIKEHYWDLDGTRYTIVILPFHVTLTDYCDQHQRQVKASFYNGRQPSIQNLQLGPEEKQTVNHGVKAYKNLTIGAFDWERNRLRLEYEGCTWYDDETWKECGECRAAQWSGQAPKCEEGGRPRKWIAPCGLVYMTGGFES
ncbi:predicted protein [Plenodomus lingam JN3]|uniref:Predicted protein n=1 Tax=Leptosphaeria maculans (strain JN3 / isolate v23.1.3 / race Av1-4-5-6-7-8) TaxID=985895 RepID=E4ZYG4_LEPMJ|nr:predicted protein [Plenodomus lingam JN3]CBX96490.1 predicted protein [Plenodomus lingam JN3]